MRRGRPADPLGRLRRLRADRLQPVGAALHASTASRRTSTRARTSARATCCSWSASTTGTARSSRARRSGTWPRTPSGVPASTRGRRASRSCSSWSRSRVAAQRRRRAGALRATRSTTRPCARTSTSRTCTWPDASFEDVAKLTGLIGHIHLSDCDGKVHGDLPAGRGVTPIKEYLRRSVDTGYDGAVSIELEYSPEPARRSSSGRSRPTTARRRSCPSSASASRRLGAPPMDLGLRGQGRDRHRGRRGRPRRRHRDAPGRGGLPRRRGRPRRGEACAPSSGGSARREATASGDLSTSRTSRRRWWPRRGAATAAWTCSSTTPASTPRARGTSTPSTSGTPRWT